VIAAEQLSALPVGAPLVDRARPTLRPVPTGPLAGPLAGPTPRTAAAPTALLDDGPTVSQLDAARAAARRQLAAPARVMRSVAMALLEIEAGSRSAEQLERRCDPDLWERIDGRLPRRGGAFVTGSALLRVMCQEHSPGLADGVAVVRRGQRINAIAMRIDARDGRWMVTDLDF
jgi:hypothetical protein